MVNNLYLKQHKMIPKRNRRMSRRLRAKAKTRSIIILIVCFVSIMITAFLVAKNYYITNKSKDLVYSVEYNFTHGLLSQNKLLRVQRMSFVSSDGKSATVDVFGLSKEFPHKRLSIRGDFKKSRNDSWYLQHTEILD